MKTYHLYEHPTYRFQAVKVGVSWPGFFFGFFWILVKPYPLALPARIITALRPSAAAPSVRYGRGTGLDVWRHSRGSWCHRTYMDASICASRLDVWLFEVKVLPYIRPVMQDFPAGPDEIRWKRPHLVYVLVGTGACQALSSPV